MSVVSGEGLSLAFGRKRLWEDAHFSIGAHERVGLIGANGTGKSSLMKILAGRMEPDAGRVRFRRDARVGYLPQELADAGDGPVVEMVLRSVPGRDALEARRHTLEAQLAQGCSEEEGLEWAQELADLHVTLGDFESRFGRHRAQSILQGLGFSSEAMAKDVTELSGGWRMRAALAGLLLQSPDVLLLDEPTNHLDVPTLGWFDEFLKRYPSAILLISHDRDFLNRQVGRILSLEVEGVRSYAGNYDDYRRLRAAELESLNARAERQAARRAELQGFIDRFGAKASKARQAQSRAKQLEKEEVIEVQQERQTVHFRFPEVARSGREVLSVEGVDKAYGPQPVYRGLSVRLERGQRVAVVGLNGAGKSTLLKIIAGDVAADTGAVTLGPNVVMGYYAQHHAEALDPTHSILEEVRPLAPDKPESHLRGVLGAFLFSGDDVEKAVGVLSGGERARVALAKLLLKPANFLLLDEPTNHLDLDSSEMLIEALEGYQGTLLFVSHNRSFLNRLATHVWEVSAQTVNVFPGNLDDYLEKVRRDALAQLSHAADSGPTEGLPASGREAEKARKRAEAEARQRRHQTEGPLRKRIVALEARIAALESEQKAREQSLADPLLYNDFTRAKPLMDAHRDGQEALTALYAEWERAEGELAAVAEER